MVESILGALLEHFSEETVTNSVLYEDFGIYLDNSLDENHEKKEYMIYDWKDVIDALVMKYSEIDTFRYILDEIKYWNIDEEKPAIEEITGEDDNIKRAMLQWATERSI